MSDTIQERQKRQLAVITSTLDHDLPPLLWHIYPVDLDDGVEAQICASDEESSMAALQAWAEFLGVDVVSTPREDYVEVRVTAVREGVRISIYDHHRKTYTFKRITEKGPATS